MLAVNGNCSYKFDSPDNYLLPHSICKVEETTGRVLVETKHCSKAIRNGLVQMFGSTGSFVNGPFEYHTVNASEYALALYRRAKV